MAVETIKGIMYKLDSDLEWAVHIEPLLEYVRPPRGPLQLVRCVPPIAPRARCCLCCY